MSENIYIPRQSIEELEAVLRASGIPYSFIPSEDETPGGSVRIMSIPVSYAEKGIPITINFSKGVMSSVSIGGVSGFDATSIQYADEGSDFVDFDVYLDSNEVGILRVGR